MKQEFKCMAQFTINQETLNNESLPSFTLTIEGAYTTTIYSDMEIQAKLVNVLREKITVLDQHEGLYDRLTVEAHIAFFHKWFGSRSLLLY